MDVLTDPSGCPERVWDGPYVYRCGMGVEVCARHGRFRTLEPAVIFDELRSKGLFDAAMSNRWRDAVRTAVDQVMELRKAEERSRRFVIARDELRDEILTEQREWNRRRREETREL